MKTITLLCAILWGIATLVSAYQLVTMVLFSGYAFGLINAVMWLATKGITAAFFFVLWMKQD